MGKLSSLLVGSHNKFILRPGSHSIKHLQIPKIYLIVLLISMQVEIK